VRLPCWAAGDEERRRRASQVTRGHPRGPQGRPQAAQGPRRRVSAGLSPRRRRRTHAGHCHTLPVLTRRGGRTSTGVRGASDHPRPRDEQCSRAHPLVEGRRGGPCGRRTRTPPGACRPRCRRRGCSRGRCHCSTSGVVRMSHRGRDDAQAEDGHDRRATFAADCHTSGDAATLCPTMNLLRVRRQALGCLPHRGGRSMSSGTRGARMVHAKDPLNLFSQVRGSLRWCPRQDSNLRSRLRRAVLYPLSYGGR
jgi:hypothetical protein